MDMSEIEIIDASQCVNYQPTWTCPVPMKWQAVPATLYPRPAGLKVVLLSLLALEQRPRWQSHPKIHQTLKDT
jgi:hypothetical protein